MVSGKIYGVAYKPNGTKSSVYDVWLSWNSIDTRKFKTATLCSATFSLAE